jgi:hypothetical protein
MKNKMRNFFFDKYKEKGLIVMSDLPNKKRKGLIVMGDLPK